MNMQPGTMACLGFQPVVDGTIVKDLPVLMRQCGEYTAMPEMIGVTTEEAFQDVPDGLCAAVCVALSF